jgi:hypothetical protein
MTKWVAFLILKRGAKEVLQEKSVMKFCNNTKWLSAKELDIITNPILSNGLIDPQCSRCLKHCHQDAVVTAPRHSA